MISSVNCLVVVVGVELGAEPIRIARLQVEGVDLVILIRVFTPKPQPQIQKQRSH